MIKTNKRCGRNKQCVVMVGVEESKRESGAGCGASQTQRRVLRSRNKYLP